MIDPRVILPTQHRPAGAAFALPLIPTLLHSLALAPVVGDALSPWSNTLNLNPAVILPNYRPTMSTRTEPAMTRDSTAPDVSLHANENAAFWSRHAAGLPEPTIGSMYHAPATPTDIALDAAQGSSTTPRVVDQAETHATPPVVLPTFADLRAAVQTPVANTNAGKVFVGALVGGIVVGYFAAKV